MPHSTRNQARILAFKIIYNRLKIGINPTGEQILFTEAQLTSSYLEFSQQLVEKTWSNLSEIDSAIQKNLINWKQTRISESLNALLKIAACELLCFPETDSKIVFNEAIEICKTYVDQKATKICNGVLHAISKEIAEKK